MKVVLHGAVYAFVLGIGAWCAAAPAPVLETEPKEYATFSGHGDSVEALSFSADGKTLASAGRGDRRAKLWDVEHRKLIATFEGPPIDPAHVGPKPSQLMESVSISPDGKTLASGGYSIPLQLLDIEGTKDATNVPCDQTVVEKIVFSPDGKQLA